MSLLSKLVRKKECYILTWWGRLGVLFCFIILLYLAFIRFPVFLSKSSPVEADTLIIDGNMPDYVLEEAARIFNTDNYTQIVTTGSDFISGYHIAEIKSMPEYSRTTLIKLGIEPAKITAVPSGRIYKNRTYTSGKKLKEWFVKNGANIEGVNVITSGCHARRSQYLFQKALGKEIEVGVISVENKSYDNKRWWKSSKGVRTIISETIGYVYSVMFYFPEKD